jgi:hypothetical protein
LSGPVTLTAIISAGRTILGSDAGVESLRHNIDGRFANLELEKDGGRDVLIDLQMNNSFRVDRRMALRASLSLLSAVFNWRILGLSSSHRLQGETHA